jgi:hypothetical protein
MISLLFDTQEQADIGLHLRIDSLDIDTDNRLRTEPAGYSGGQYRQQQNRQNNPVSRHADDRGGLVPFFEGLKV